MPVNTLYGNYWPIPQATFGKKDQKTNPHQGEPRKVTGVKVLPGLVLIPKIPLIRMGIGSFRTRSRIMSGIRESKVHSVSNGMTAFDGYLCFKNIGYLSNDARNILLGRSHGPTITEIRKMLLVGSNEIKGNKTNPRIKYVLARRAPTEKAGQTMPVRTVEVSPEGLNIADTPRLRLEIPNGISMAQEGKHKGKKTPRTIAVTVILPHTDPEFTIRVLPKPQLTGSGKKLNISIIEQPEALIPTDILNIVRNTLNWLLNPPQKKKQKGLRNKA